MNLVLISGDDWQGLYIDGKLSCEGHRIRLSDVMEHLISKGKSIKSYTEKECNYEWLNDMGTLPSFLEFVIFRK